MAIGDIGQGIDTYTLAGGACREPYTLKVTDNIIVVAYTYNHYGWIKTIEIDNEGNIITPEIDSYNFSTRYCEYIKVVKVSDNVIAIGLSGPYSMVGWLKTIGISNTGIITKPFIDSYIFSGSCWPFGGFLHVAGDVYAFTYSTSSAKGYVATVEIDSLGNITEPLIDSVLFSGFAHLQDLTHVTDNIYAISYKGSGNDGYIATVNIDDDGSISTIIDSYMFAGYIVANRILNVAPDMIAVVHVGSSDNGYVRTFEIDNAGNITTPEKDFWRFDSYCYDITVTHISADVGAIAYQGTGSFGYFRTFKVTAGVIGSIDLLPHVGQTATNMHIAHVNGNIYVLAYQHSIIIKTLDIETTLLPAAGSSALPLFTGMLI